MERRGVLRCPVCNAAAASPATRPFCSERCRSVDLGRWLDGSYRIAGDPVDPAAHLTRGDEAVGAALVDGAKESTCE